MEGPLRSMSIDALSARVGGELGVSEWFRIDQAMIDAFADLTQDRYFIHIDPARAASDWALASNSAMRPSSFWRSATHADRSASTSARNCSS